MGSSNGSYSYEEFITECSNIYIKNANNMNDNKVVTYFDLLVKITNNFDNFFAEPESTISSYYHYNNKKRINISKWSHGVEKGKIISRMSGHYLYLCDVRWSDRYGNLLLMASDSSTYHLISKSNKNIFKYFFPTFILQGMIEKYYVERTKNYCTMMEQYNLSQVIDKSTVNKFIAKLSDLIENTKSQLKLFESFSQNKINILEIDKKKIEDQLEINSTDLFLQKIKCDILIDIKNINDNLKNKKERKNLIIKILQNLSDSFNVSNSIEFTSVKYSNCNLLPNSYFIKYLFNYIYNQNKIMTITKFETIGDLLILLDQLNPMSDRLLSNYTNENINCKVGINHCGDYYAYVIIDQKYIRWHKNSEQILGQLIGCFDKKSSEKINKKFINDGANHIHNEIKNHENVLSNYKKEIEYYQNQREFINELNNLQSQMKLYEYRIENYILNIKHLEKIIITNDKL